MLKYVSIISLFAFCSCSLFRFLDKSMMDYIPCEVNNVDNNEVERFIYQDYKYYCKDDSVDISRTYKIIQAYKSFDEFTVSIGKPKNLLEGEISSYYFPFKNDVIIDYAIASYNFDELYKVDLFSKGDSAVNLLKFYEDSLNVKFSKEYLLYNKHNYYPVRYKDYNGLNHKDTVIVRGYFKKRNIYITFFRDLIFDELHINVLNFANQPISKPI